MKGTEVGLSPNLITVDIDIELVELLAGGKHIIFPDSRLGFRVVSWLSLITVQYIQVC